MPQFDPITGYSVAPRLTNLESPQMEAVTGRPLNLDRGAYVRGLAEQYPELAARQRAREIQDRQYELERDALSEQRTQQRIGTGLQLGEIGYRAGVHNRLADLFGGSEPPSGLGMFEQSGAPSSLGKFVQSMAPSGLGDFTAGATEQVASRSLPSAIEGTSFANTSVSSAIPRSVMSTNPLSAIGAAGVGTGVGRVFANQPGLSREQSALAGAASGVLTGAAYGSFVPGIGTGVGALVGGLFGGIGGLFK